MNEHYSYFLISNGKWFTNPSRFVHRSALPGQGFASLYAVTAETATAVAEETTPAGFKGCVWSERLWIDFDDEQAGMAARRQLSAWGLDHVVFSTGNRGFHIGVLRSAQPSHLLPARDKQWVVSNLQGADTSIYSHLHLFRVPGAVHEASGRKKSLIEHVAGKVLELPPLAEEKHGVVTSHPVGDGCDVSVFDSKRIMCNSVPQNVGDRHAALVKCCYALKDFGVAPENALWWLGEVNKLFEEPKSAEQIAQVVQSIY